MKRIIELATEIRRISDNMSPVIYDLSYELVELLENAKFYTRDEVISMIERTDPDIPDYDPECN